MRRMVEIFVAACFYYSGLVKLAVWWRWRSGPSLMIMAYHRASGGDLRRHLLYLHRHYRILHLEEALEELYAVPQERKQERDRRTPLVLTFDDGYRDSYTHAFALARELKIPITIFLIPGYIENGDYFWWLEGKRLARRTQMHTVNIEGHVYQLQQAEQRALLAQAIDARLRHATSVAERESFLMSAREALRVPSTVTLDEEVVRPLTWGEVRKMEESGWVSFGAHTMHHPILACLSSPEEVRREVGDSRIMLEQQLGHPVRTIAYPIGKPEHIGKAALQAVREAGFAWAVTTTYGVNTPENDPRQLRRITSDDDRHWLLMAAKTSGVSHFFSPPWRRKLK